MIHPDFKRSLVLTTAGLCTCLALFVCGCDDSREADVNVEISQNVNEAKRGISASEESQGLTPAEIDRAMEIGLAKTGRESRQKQLAGQVAKRMALELQNAEGLDQDQRLEFNKSVDELVAMLTQALTDGLSSDQQKTLNDRMMAYSINLLEQDRKVSDFLSKEADAKLATALVKLEKAIANVKPSDPQELRASLLAPELTKGAIGLIRLHKAMGTAGQKYLGMHPLQVEVNKNVLSYIQEVALTSQIEARRPTESIERLQAILGNWKTDLTNLDKKIADLKIEQDKYQVQYDTNFKAAKAINFEYLTRMEEARKVRGQQRYAIEDAAYQLKLGTEGKPGGLYYDSRTEIAATYLNSVKDRVAFEKSRYDLARENIAALTNTISQLKTAPETTTDIDNALAKNSSEKARLMDAVRQSITNLDTAEKAYQAFRGGVMEQFETVTKTLDAIKDIPTGTPKNAKSEQDLKNFSERLKYNTIREMAAFLPDGARSYEAVAQMLSLVVGDIDETPEHLIKIITDYNTKAQTATAKAEKMTKDLPVIVPGKPQPPQNLFQVPGSAPANNAVDQSGQDEMNPAEGSESDTSDENGEAMEDDSGGF
ncbi:MAG: hypothetical protein K9M57_05520 [Phycisphaerae bacterium]|nr:hypothetical protein [Phycisphaerae bacterium]